MGTPYDACPVCGREPFSVGVFSPCECRRAARLAEIAAEEAAGLRRFEVDEWPIRDGRLEAMYTEFNRPGGLAVRLGLPNDVRRLRELEARGYYLWTVRLLKGYTGPVVGKMAENRAFMYGAERPEDVPHHTVRAVGCVIEEMEPGWVEAVAESRRYADSPRAGGVVRTADRGRAGGDGKLAHPTLARRRPPGRRERRRG